MTYDIKHVGSPDRDRISLGDDYDVHDWAGRLGVSADHLCEAGDAAGNSANTGRAYRKKP